MKSFFVTALLLSSIYASAQSTGMASPAAPSATGTSVIAPSAGSGASTGVNPDSGTSDTPASGAVIDRSINRATETTTDRQKMEDSELNRPTRDANLRKGRRIESKDKMLTP